MLKFRRGKKMQVRFWFYEHLEHDIGMEMDLGAYFVPQKILVLLGTFYQNRTDEASNLGKNSQKWAFQKIKALEKRGKKGPKSTKIFWGTK